METLSKLYQAANGTALVGWLILITLPKWQFSDTIIKNGIVVALAIFYVYLLFIRKDIPDQQYPAGNFSTLQGVTNLFMNPKSVLLGWTHYLAFDLMLGIYIKTQATNAGISHWLQIPCFICTFLLGPIGYLLFLLILRLNTL
jgi:hypothetical protein